MDMDRFAVRLTCELRARCGDHPAMFEAVTWAVLNTAPPEERGREWDLAVRRLADDIEDYVGAEGVPLEPRLADPRPSPWRHLVKNAVLRVWC